MCALGREEGRGWGFGMLLLPGIAHSDCGAQLPRGGSGDELPNSIHAGMERKIDGRDGRGRAETDFYLPSDSYFGPQIS
jgi:hypothetical protein